MAKRPNAVITESITEALILLMQSEAFSKITITDITQKAGVSRVSFYRNFQGKEDVLCKHLRRITDEFTAQTGFDFRRDAHQPLLLGLFRHLQSHRMLISTLQNAGLLFMVKEEFDRVFLKHEDENTPKHVCYMAAGAYYNLFYYWVLDGFKEAPEELADINFSI